MKSLKEILNRFLQREQQIFSNRLYKGILLGIIGALVFEFAYAGVNLLFIHVYGSASCSGVSKLGVFITAPLNYCEDLTYASVSEGVYANLGVIFLIILLSILYVVRFEGRAKEYLSFKNAFVVSVASTYLLSALSWVITGKPLGGTSIIGFNLLLFLFMGLAIDHTYVSRNGKGELRKLAKTSYPGWVVKFNSLFGKKISVREGTYRAYAIKKSMIAWCAAIAVIMIVVSYLSTASYSLHMSGGFLLLLYVFITNRHKLLK